MKKFFPLILIFSIVLSSLALALDVDGFWGYGDPTVKQTSINVGDSVNLNAYATTHSENLPLKLDFVIVKQGSPNFNYKLEDNTLYDGDPFVRTYTIGSSIYNGVGKYLVTLNAENNKGHTNYIDLILDVTNTIPIINSINLNNPSGIYNEGDLIIITINATDSDPGQLLTYLVNDSRFVQDPLNNNIFSWQTNYEDEGVYPIKIGVTDGYSEVSQTIIITVLNTNRPPFVDFSFSPLNPEVYDIITFTPNISDPDDDVVTAIWNLGDGTILTKAHDEIVTHSYNLPGYYVVTLVVDDGTTQTSVAKAVTITGNLEIVELTDAPIGFPTIKGHERHFSARVQVKGNNVKNALLNFYLSNGTMIGSCNTLENGMCSTQYVFNKIGNYTVYAEAHKVTYTSDVSKAKTVDFEVIEEAYFITGLKTYSDSVFSNATNTFYRGEKLYVEFTVLDYSNNLVNDGLDVEVSLQSSSGGQISLKRISYSGSEFRHYITIPYSDDFLNKGFVISVVVNSTSNTGGQSQVSVDILNNPPVIGAMQTLFIMTQGQTKYITLSGSDVEDDLLALPLKWSVSNVDSSMLNVSLNGNILSMTALKSGSTSFTLTLTDSDNGKDTKTISVVIDPTIGPSVLILSPTDFGTYGSNTNISFYADVNGTLPLTYLWDFGDSTTSTEVSPVHSYDKGNYTITLTVTDANGISSSDSVRINIIDLLKGPVAVIKVNKTTAFVDEILTFDGTDSIEGDAVITSYEWNFGDGTSSISKIVNHKFSSVGTYNVELTVTDANGLSDSTISTITIKDYKMPVADAGNDMTVYVNEEFFVNGINSYSPNGNIIEYSWNFGDGSISNNMIVGKSYSEEGNYTITLTVTDELGFSDSDSITVTVVKGIKTREEIEKEMLRKLRIPKVSFVSSGGSTTGNVFDGTPGAMIATNVLFKNTGDYTLKGLSMTFSIPDLNLIHRSGHFELDPGKTASKTLYFILPEDTSPGNYYAKITVKGENVYRMKYALMRIK